VDVGPFVRAELKVQAARLQGSRSATLAEIGASGLTREQAGEALRLLEQAQAEIAKLTHMAAGVAKMPAGQAGPSADTLASAAQKIVDARVAARRAVCAFPVGRPGGFRTVVAHSMQKIPRTEPVLSGPLAVRTRVRLEAARDEAESFQVVIVPGGESLKGVRVDAGPLLGPGRAALPVEWSRVGYVETAKPAYSTEYVGWWPDVLIPGDGTFDVAGDQRQPLWFSVNVPADALPGLYKGRVRIACGEQVRGTPVELRVRTFRLPRPGTLPVAFGIYAQALSKWYHGEKSYR